MTMTDATPAYDPRAWGARCDVCILAETRDGDPVAPEWHGSPVSLVGEAPGQAEVLACRPLVGPSGHELQRALDVCGVRRDDVNLHNALACRPPSNALVKVRAKLAKINRERRKEGRDLLPDPLACCRPRLMAELSTVGTVITLGKEALAAVVPPPTNETGRPQKHGSLRDTAGSLLDTVCTDDKRRRVVPALHPAFVLRAPRWRVPFRRSLSRAFRWFAGRLTWDEPRITYWSGVHDPARFGRTTADLGLLDRWLAVWQQQPAGWVDVETNHIEPLIATVRCVQIGTGDDVAVVWLRDLSGRPCWQAHELPAVIDLLHRALVRDPPPVCGHNYGSYDVQALAPMFHAAGYIDYWPSVDTDTILLHRYVDPDLPHSLAHVGATWTDVHAWKADHTAIAARNEEDLARYGALDVAVNARVTAPLLRAAVEKKTRADMAPELRPLVYDHPSLMPPRAHGQARCTLSDFDPVLVVDHGMQAVCGAMHRFGIGVDQAVRRDLEGKYRAMERRWVDEVQALIAAHTSLPGGWDERTRRDGTIARKPLFNPRSTLDMRRLIIDEWDLPPPEHLPKMTLYTSSGDRSVGDAILRAYLADPTLDDAQHRILYAIRKAKKARTIYGRYLAKLAPFGAAVEVYDDDEGTTRRSPVLAVWEDGRLRVGWSAHTTGVGRLSSGGKPSRINAQTIPHELRRMFVPAPGHWYAGADLSSVHLRIIANLWRIPSLLRCYADDGDPHADLASIVFGETFTQADGWPCEKTNFEWAKPAKRYRSVAKALRYAGAYMAQVPTIHATMTRDAGNAHEMPPDDPADRRHGDMAHRRLTVSQVRAYYSAWMGAEPEWRQAWDHEIAMFRRYGFLRSPILGRRADFSDGEDPNKIVNYRILSGEADLMGPITIRVHNRLADEVAPRLRPGERCGIVGQFHDQIVTEQPERLTEHALRIIVETMNVEVPGWPVPITADGRVGTDWSFSVDPRRTA